MFSTCWTKVCFEKVGSINAAECLKFGTLTNNSTVDCLHTHTHTQKSRVLNLQYLKWYLLTSSVIFLFHYKPYFVFRITMTPKILWIQQRKPLFLFERLFAVPISYCNMSLQKRLTCKCSEFQKKQTSPLVNAVSVSPWCNLHCSRNVKKRIGCL